MSELFGRKIEVVTDTRKFNGDDFTISFEVPFDDDAEPNIATVEIYNLTDDTITQIGKGKNLTLNAGYQKDVGTIFSGVIQLPQTEWQSVDKITTLDCMDSGDGWFKKTVNKTYKAGINAEQILKDLLSQSGLSIGALKLPNNKAYARGKTVKSTIAQAVAEIARDCGAKMHVNKNKIFIRPKNEGDNIRFVVDKEHGLIGSPTQIEKEVTTGKDKAGNDIKKTVRGWKIVSLLNHRITTDSIIEIKSRTANGVFRVESGKHSGGGSSFYTECEVYPL